jgi:HD-like signal output (HDOD) protein
METIQNDKSSAAALEAVILRDQALTAKVLRAANSAYYGHRGQISTISRALVTVGFHEVQRICLCALLMEHFCGAKPDQEIQQALWKHAFATARLASNVAQKRPWMSQEEAYVAGLLHDLGRMVLFHCFYAQYVHIQDLANTLKIPFSWAEWQYGITHTQVGKWLAVRWNFPKLIEHVLTFHHIPWKSPLFRKEIRLIYLADVLAHYREYPELATAEPTRTCCKQLYIGDEEWQNHCDRVATVWDEVDAFWRMLK